jgi:transposase
MAKILISPLGVGGYFKTKKVRPIYHYKGERVKAHIFLCMLAYYVEWHLRQSRASLLFEDEEIDDNSVNVIKANRSESAKSVECTLKEGSYRFSKVTRPTSLQQKALDLLGVSLLCTQ